MVLMALGAVGSMRWLLEASNGPPAVVYVIWGIFLIVAGYVLFRVIKWLPKARRNMDENARVTAARQDEIGRRHGPNCPGCGGSGRYNRPPFGDCPY
jgi:hypothetical protein